VEAGIALMNDRMLGGRWKVFRGTNDGWLEEYRLYHRDSDGKHVKKNDDAISASRYALMKLRDARTDDNFNRPIVYPRGWELHNAFGEAVRDWPKIATTSKLAD